MWTVPTHPKHRDFLCKKGGVNIKKSNINPVWHDSKKWETSKNEMYSNRVDDVKIYECFELLKDVKTLKEKMQNVTIEYPIETEVMFTNKMFNPVSWLGQATCNLILSATQKETCNAWIMLTMEEREKANKIAKQVINEWRDKYENLHRR